MRDVVATLLAKIGPPVPCVYRMKRVAHGQERRVRPHRKEKRGGVSEGGVGHGVVLLRVLPLETKEDFAAIVERRKPDGANLAVGFVLPDRPDICRRLRGK